MTDIAEKSRTQRQEEIAKLVATRHRSRTLRATVQALRRALLRAGRSRGPRRSARPPTCTARRCRTGTSRASASRASARVRVFNPTIEEHGWQSTHTIIEIVNDDMPFLVDSVTMEVNRHGLTLHLIVHPIIAVERDADGTLTGLAPRRRGDASARIVHPRRGRPHRPTPRALDALAADIARVLDDVRAAVDDWKTMRDKAARDRRASSTRAPPPLPAGRARRRQGVPRAGSPTTISRSSATAATTSSRVDGAGCAADRPRLEPRHPARDRRARTSRRASPRCRRRCARMRGGPSSSSSPSRRRARPCIGPAISTTSRVKRFDAQGKVVRRASLPRPLHVDRVQRQPGRHPAPAAQDRQRRRARGPRRRAATPARR